MVAEKVDDDIVGFSVFLQASDPRVPANAKVDWDGIRTNVGGGFNGGFDPVTKDFVCPVDGTYVFNIDVSVGFDDTYRAGLEIVQDRTTVAQAIGQSYNRYSAASHTVVIECNNGQRVWVKCESCCECEMVGVFTSFSGFLLK